MVKSLKYLDSILQQLEDDFRLKKITNVLLLNFWMYLIEGVKKLLREDHGSLQMNLKLLKGLWKWPPIYICHKKPTIF